MWLVLSLLTALATSAQDITAKRTMPQTGPYLVAWGWVFFSIPFMVIALFFNGAVVLKQGFWLTLMCGGALLTVSGITLFKAIEAGELSVTLPILSFTPLFMVVTSPIIVGEFPGVWGVIGILLIITGSWVLFYDPACGGPAGALRRLWSARSSRLMLVTAVLFSIGANVDKVGVLQSSPLAWGVALNTVVSIGIGILSFRRTSDPAGKVWRSFPWLLLMGFFAAIMMFVQMTALTLAPAAHVIAIKRISILFSSLAGFYFWGEKGAAQRIPAILLMLAGIFVISFFK